MPRQLLQHRSPKWLLLMRWLNVLSDDTGSHWLEHRHRRQSAALVEVSPAAAPSRSVHNRGHSAASSFLLLERGLGSNTISRVASSFEAVKPKFWYGVTQKTPKLSEVRLRLLYQTPDVYMTDVAKQRRPAKFGFRYACKLDPDEETGLGEIAIPPRLHPSLTFNGKVRKIHVHLEDTKTGEVFWDADFKMRRGPIALATGKTTLSSMSLPQDPSDVFRTPCVPPDDPEPHMFDLSVQTQDGVYDDGLTPWGPREGFRNLDGRKAHIGFEAYRVPIIKTGLDGEEEEVMGNWKPGGHFSTGPVHPDRFERILAKEEDPFWDDLRGNGRLYYDYIIRPEARSRNNYGYLDKYAVPKFDKFL